MPRDRGVGEGLGEANSAATLRPRLVACPRCHGSRSSTSACSAPPWRSGFASWPIVAADTDLWYHLNAGRFIAANGALPQTAFFSFLRPAPVWLDYYWLSQLVFYGVHSAAGYLGLVELRALAALATYALILATLRLGQRGEGWGWTAIVFTAAALFLVGRLTLLRPGELLVPLDRGVPVRPRVAARPARAAGARARSG